MQEGFGDGDRDDKETAIDEEWHDQERDPPARNRQTWHFGVGELAVAIKAKKTLRINELKEQADQQLKHVSRRLINYLITEEVLAQEGDREEPVTIETVVTFKARKLPPASPPGDRNQQKERSGKGELILEGKEQVADGGELPEGADRYRLRAVWEQNHWRAVTVQAEGGRVVSEAHLNTGGKQEAQAAHLHQQRWNILPEEVKRRHDRTCRPVEP